jgi:hypothetical protein
LEVRKKIQENEFESDKLISNAILSNRPSLIGRLGGTEARILSCYLDIVKGKSLLDPVSTFYSALTFHRRISQLNIGAGFYPKSVGRIMEFASQYVELLSETDILGAWGATFTWPEHLLVTKTDVKFVPLVTTSPWVDSYPSRGIDTVPWSGALQGKKVLIVSTFSRSFSNQFLKMNEVFENKHYHNFEPIFLNAPMTQGGLKDGKSWFYHLEKTKNEMEKISFDVALISAGAYSYPLAGFAKSLGKVGVHSGGELQLFFGVLGHRWEKYYKYTEYKNSHWVRPHESERPSNWRNIEDGCYW